MRYGVAARHNAGHRAMLREWLRDYLLAHPCVDCGEEDLRCLQFDHVTGEKVEDLAVMFGKARALVKIIEEVGKCVVRCANCHQRKTAADFGWWSHVFMESKA